MPKESFLIINYFRWVIDKKLIAYQAVVGAINRWKTAIALRFLIGMPFGCAVQTLRIMVSTIRQATTTDVGGVHSCAHGDA